MLVGMPSTFTPAYRSGGSGSPLVLIHGFTDTWRSWEPILPALEQHHDVLAPTMAGHAGGPKIDESALDTVLVDEIERAMDDAGFETAHVVGNSLGGYVAMQLAERGRARSVVALAPAGGWPADDPAEFEFTHQLMRTIRRQVPLAARLARVVAATRVGRRVATRTNTSHARHISAELLRHQIRGAQGCVIADPLLAGAREVDWHLEAERIECPVRIVWGTADRLLRYPGAATRYREEWFPDADWIELEGVGHCPQLDDPNTVSQLILEVTGSVPA
jgi:pimeloyl-ACP methyl ester carboxylesterase